jgi:DUF1680 family protein
VRFLASMPGYIYARGPDDTIYLNLYVSSEAPFEVTGGTLRLSVNSERPWSGRSKITVAAERDVKAIVKLRMPGWTRGQVLPGNLYSCVNKVDRPSTISINGTRLAAVADQAGYVSIDPGRARHGDRHRQTEYRRHAGGMRRARDGRASVRHAEGERRQRLVPAVA